MNITYNLIFKPTSNNLGFVYVNYSLPKHKPVRISTQIKISDKDFKKYYSKDPLGFKDKFDNKDLKDKVKELLLINPFIQAKPTTKPLIKDFLEFFKENNDRKHGNTKDNYDKILKKLKQYYPSLPFDEINNKKITEIKNRLSKEMTPTSVNHYLKVIRTTINAANDDEICNIYLNKKLFKVTEVVIRKDLLTDNDIDKLLNYPVYDKFAYEALYASLQYTLNGARFSDILFLKIKDFKKDKLEFRNLKTKKLVNKTYSISFLKILHKYLYRNDVYRNDNIDYTLNDTLNDNIDHLGLNNDEVYKDILLKEIFYKFKKEYGKDDFLFSLPETLLNYKIENNFTDIELKEYHKAHATYNYRLRCLKNLLNFDTEQFSSHSLRYKFVAWCLEMDVSIYDIKEALNHSSVTVTEKYIAKNFTIKTDKNISKKIDEHRLGIKTDIRNNN